MAIVRRYVSGLQRIAPLVIVFWLTAGGFGGWKGLELLSHTAVQLEPPSGSPSAAALSVFQSQFPEVADLVPVIVVLQSRAPRASALGKDTEQFTYALLSGAQGYPEKYVSADNFQSYYTFLNMSLEPLADATVSPDNATTIIVMNVDVPGGVGMNADTKKFVNFMDDLAKNLAAQYFPDKSVSVRLTGDLVFGRDFEDGSEHDLLLMDGIAFPIALVILCFVLRSARLLIIPVLNIAISILTSFLLVLPISLTTLTVSFTPSLMMSATIAMSIDYSLFLLSRFREELLAMRPVDFAVRVMLETSGHTVIVSGATLSLCFLGLIFFQVTMLSIPGLASALAITVAVLVNLTLTPSLLLVFPRFFARCIHPCNSPCTPADADESRPILSPAAAHLSGLPDSTELRKSRWFRFGLATTRWPWSILLILLVAGLAVPCAMSALKLERSLSILYLAPRASEATDAYKELDVTFGTGRLFPYDLVAVPAPGLAILSPEFFNAAGNLLRDLAALPVNASFLGVMALGTTILSYDDVSLCLLTCDDICGLFCQARKQFINANSTATYIEIRLDFNGADPFGPVGSDWLSKARAALDKASAQTNVTFYLGGGAGPGFDIVDKVYNRFPMAIGITTAVVVVLTGLAFRSVVIPIRAVFSLFLTLAFSYGIAVWVYQDGVLDFFSWAPLAGSGAMCWLVPVMAFSILVGLGLDYDIFLLTRIREYRAMGVADPGDDSASNVLMGLAQTGGVITAAGAIMAIAFLGLLFSGEPVLNQLSFLLVFSVLFDTLVVRSVLVPAMMTLLGRWNWWPGSQQDRGAAYNVQEYYPLIRDSRE